MKDSDDARLTYAYSEVHERLVYVDEVPNGNECNCTCPKCKEALCAKNEGTHRTHHFAHISGKECIGATETALHRLAKEVLAEIKCLCLPSIEGVCESELSTFEKVDIEPLDKELSLRPDCIGYHKNGRAIWIEFKQTHAVDTAKKDRIREEKVDCLEIDLKDCELDRKKIELFIKEKSNNRKWIYYHRIPRIKTKQKSDSVNPNDNRQKFENSTHIQRRMHFAIDEQGDIIDTYHTKVLDPECTFHCLGCGNSIHFDKQRNCFVHSEAIKECNERLYLSNAARTILRYRFLTSTIYIRYSSIEYDIKLELGYKYCRVLPNKLIVFSRNDESKDDIFVCVNGLDFMEILRSEHRLIIVPALKEEHLYNLLYKSLEQSNSTFLNFKNRDSLNE